MWLSRVGFTRPKLSLSMRARNSAYAFWYTTDIPTDRPTDTYISREISIEHPSVGLLCSPNYKTFQSPEIFISTYFEKEAQTLKKKQPKTQNASRVVIKKIHKKKNCHEYTNYTRTKMPHVLDKKV